MFDSMNLFMNDLRTIPHSICFFYLNVALKTAEIQQISAESSLMFTIEGLT